MNEINGFSSLKKVIDVYKRDKKEGRKALLKWFLERKLFPSDIKYVLLIYYNSVSSFMKRIKDRGLPPLGVALSSVQRSVLNMYLNASTYLILKGDWKSLSELKKCIAKFPELGEQAVNLLIPALLYVPEEPALNLLRDLMSLKSVSEGLLKNVNYFIYLIGEVPFPNSLILTEFYLNHWDKLQRYHQEFLLEKAEFLCLLPEKLTLKGLNK